MKLQGWAVAGKAWVGLVGSFLTFIVPWVVQYSSLLPAPWPAVIGAVVAVLTAVGVYHAPSRSITPTTPTTGSTPWPTS